MKEKIWTLFKLTGDVKYYIMYKEMERADLNGNDQGERDSN